MRKRLSSRAPASGFTLISVLSMLILLAAIAALTQQQAVSQARVLTRINRDAAAEMSARTLLHLYWPVIAEKAIAQVPGAGNRNLPLNGAPVRFELSGAGAFFTAQDVDALPDLFFSSNDLFARLFPEHPNLAASAIESFRRDHPRMEIYSERQALAIIGLDKLAGLSDLVTLRATTPRINIQNLPPELSVAPDVLSRPEVTRMPARLLRIGFLIDRDAPTP